ncbi:MAG: serine/threonine-protein kinase [Archangium sp.]|nr:serine/threonine-protein kinase [Archangium sp.]
MPAGPSETLPSPSVALSPGALVLDGRFRVVRLLGQGGMGFVYLAEQVSLGRPVAIKVLRSDLSLTAGFAERFRREALLLSSVEHPAVVRVIDYGAHGDAPCLVMEYVEGETLEAVLTREAPLSVDRVERLLAQLATGLTAIHAKGIVHRDLKPDNVVVTKTVEGGEYARLLDFGIARLMAADEDAGAKASVTQVGIVLGTPEYVSPEQALGQPLDARSDLYALGVILFRALTGKHPFPGPSPREFISQHIHQAPPALLDLAPHLSGFPALVAAVSGCLEKDPGNRPQTAGALYTLSTSRPLTLSTTVPPPSALRAPARSMAMKAVAIGAAVGVLGALGLWFSWFNEPARKAHRLVTAGRGSEALQVLEDLGPKGQTWSLQQLRATALHQVGRHEEEWKVMASAPENDALEPLALEALADDFGHAETARLRKLLASLPKAMLLPTFQPLAQEEQRWAQWGALRFVDLEYAGQGLPLLELYVRALENRDCSVRRVAAKRLVDFRSTDAMPPLEKLKALPRKKGEEECGQAAAEAALKQLAKE